jgi:hypothetical protein
VETDECPPGKSTHMTTDMATKPLFIVLVFALACGPDETEARFPVESGIEQTRMLDSLSPSEAQSLCLASHDSGAQFFESDVVANYLCTLVGAFSATSATSTNAGAPQTVDAAQCEAIRKECSSTPTKQTRDASGCQSSSFPRTCRVSVGEFEMCAERYFEALANQWQAVSCESLAKQPQLSVPVNTVSDASNLPGCEHLNRECPGGSWPAVSPVKITREPLVVRMR